MPLGTVTRNHGDALEDELARLRAVAAAARVRPFIWRGAHDRQRSAPRRHTMGLATLARWEACPWKALF